MSNPNEKITYQGRLIEIFEIPAPPGHKVKVFENARRSPGVRVIIPKDNTILLSKEYRYEIEAYDYRLPGGKVYDSLEEYNSALKTNVDITEAAKAAATREAAEEAGIKISDMSFFHKSICGATIIWDLFYFVAGNYEKTAKDSQAGEDITVEYIDSKEVEAMCLDGRISEERSALVLLRYLKNH
jgi:8-oxo-dGTP pyrophosphatase MutT (NUDIX family)